MKSTLKWAIKGFFAFTNIMMIGILWTNLAYAEDEADKTWVELTYVEWSSEVASANVIKVVLEELDYEVELIAVSAAVMWQAVASGDVDGHVAAWLQSTHAHYLNAVKNKVENLGPNLVGTKIGLVVPQYVTINAIDELKANQFNKKLLALIQGQG